MAVKYNASARPYNTTKEEGKHKDNDKRSLETDKLARIHSSNISKGTSQVGKDSSFSRMLTKHNDDNAGGTNDAPEKEDQTDEEMENLEKTGTNLWSPGEQKNGWGLNNATAARRKTYRDTEGNQRRQTNFGGIAAIRRDSTNSSPKGNKPDDHSNPWGKSNGKESNTRYKEDRHKANENTMISKTGNQNESIKEKISALTIKGKKKAPNSIVMDT
eukprot:3994576-Ditylum_brightwellii.AAC.1